MARNLTAYAHGKKRGQKKAKANQAKARKARKPAAAQTAAPTGNTVGERLADTDYDLPARVAVCRRLAIAFRHLAEWCGNVAEDFDLLGKAFADEDYPSNEERVN